jgi:ribosomal protein S8
MMRIVISIIANNSWQFWSLGGFYLMALTLPNPGQTSFFHELDDESLASSTDRSNENIVIAKRKRISYSEILTYALPQSLKVVELNNLIDQILISQQQTSLIERDDSKTAEAMVLLSDVLNEHWQEFPLKVKVLLLNKLKVFRRSFWKSIFSFSGFHTIKNRFNYYAGYWNELKTYDSLTQKSILNKLSRDSRLLRNAWLTLKVTILKIFKSDGYLLEKNRESISEFTNSVKTMVAARQVMNKYSVTLNELAKFENDITHHNSRKEIRSDNSKNGDYRVIERTPEETAEGLRKIAGSFKRQQDLWNSMTEDEQAISNAEFLIRHEKLSRSRSE